MKSSDFNISLNKVDHDLEYGYVKEVKEIKKLTLQEFHSLSRDNSKPKTVLDANQVMNAVYIGKLLFSMLGFQTNF
jgi:hypothetical protein